MGKPYSMDLRERVVAAVDKVPPGGGANDEAIHPGSVPSRLR